MFLRNELEILKDITGEDAYIYKLAKQEQCEHNIISKIKDKPTFLCEQCGKTGLNIEAFHGSK